MSNEISIITKDPNKQFEALQKSRLSKVINDKALLNRICEAAVALLTNDKIRACDENSIMGALYKAATLNCRLEPEFGECYLVPRGVKQGNEWVQVCCFQLGYKFWKAKALESGHISYLEAREVYKEDVFSFKQGTNAFIDHEPADENSGVTTHFYARAKLKDGNELFEVINKQAAEKSRRMSDSQYDKNTKVFSEKPVGFWDKGYAAMALRRPIKNLCAALPLTPAIEQALQEDGAITYLQKDGSVMTISPLQVEDKAENVTETEVTQEESDKYQDTIEALTNMDFDQVCNYWGDFKSSELAAKKTFVILFAAAGCSKAKDVEQLSELWGTLGKWTTNQEVKQYFTDRRKVLTAKQAA